MAASPVQALGRGTVIVLSLLIVACAATTQPAERTPVAPTQVLAATPTAPVSAARTPIPASPLPVLSPAATSRPGAPQASTRTAEAVETEVGVIATGLDTPWALAFAPDGVCSSPSAQGGFGWSRRAAPRRACRDAPRARDGPRAA